MKRFFSLVALGLWLAPALQAAHLFNNPDADSAQKAPANWFNLDPQESMVQGVSTEEAYQYLQNRPSQTVIVAVIDSGVDIAHEDLQDKIWINEDEIPGNQVDDDKNGYVDDVHGWNFIGGKDGRNVVHDTQELTRLYVALKKEFEGPAGDKLKKRKPERYALYLKVKADYEKEWEEAQAGYTRFQQLYSSYQKAAAIIEDHLGKQSFTQQDLASLSTNDPKVVQAQSLLLFMAENNLNQDVFLEGEDYFMAKIKYHLNPDYDPRPIVGDTYHKIKEKGYGNNDVSGTFAEHGTHVAGIIAANRNNDLGIKGIADNVKIMPIRVVPNGDERDKDVANGIYYAVNNGAKVINMSFGKDYSPCKEAVDAAVKYAESKGVLLVHGAGNDARNIDTTANFPTRQLSVRKQANNWLEVGASSWMDAANLVGDFSNYGKKSVDVFAPGVDVYSTVPKQGYKSNSGTSMAAPVTAGIGALLFSYFPELSAQQVRDIIVQSAVRYKGKVIRPGGDQEADLVSFEELSVSGGIVNAYNAVRLAESLSRKVSRK